MSKQHKHYTRQSIEKQEDDDDYVEMPPLEDIQKHDDSDDDDSDDDDSDDDDDELVALEGMQLKDYGDEMPPLQQFRCPETGQILPDPERKEFDLERILQEIEKDDPKVALSALEKSQMAAKGMTSSHFQKCGRLETSFIEGLKSVSKFFTLQMLILI